MKNHILVLLLLGFAISCGKKSALTFSEKPITPLPQTAEVGFAEIKSAILVPHCLKCHAGVVTAATLAAWIVPGKPEQSDFFIDTESGEMPKDAPVLSTKDLELIRSYILSLSPPPVPVLTPKPIPTPVPVPVPVPTPTPSLVSFEQIKQDVLVPNRCLNCHGIGTEVKLAKWINTKSPSKSKLYTRVTDGTMPRGGPAVPLAEQALLLQYVKDYATTH